MKKGIVLKSFVTLCSAAVLSTTFVPTSAVLAAEVKYNPETTLTNEITSENFIKNDLYRQFEKELAELQASKESKMSTYSINSLNNSSVTQEEVFQLIEKYDGAQVTATATGVSHQFVNGGVNSFGTTKAAMRTLASTFQNNGHIATTGGALIGLPLAAFGAIVTAFSSGVLASKFYTAAGIMNKWVSSKSTKGGVRITLTDTFAISSARSTSKATIK